MADIDFPYQPGVMLHAAVMGAFKASGGSFEAWCNENGVTPTNARNATLGMACGPKGREMLANIIRAAGPEVVKTAYLARLNSHVSTVQRAG